MSFEFIKKENLVDVAAAIAINGLTPKLLNWALKETKNAGYLLSGGLKNYTVIQPLWRLSKVNTRAPWSQEIEINEQNMHGMLFKILNADGGDDTESLKWVFLKEFFFMLKTHGNTNNVSRKRNDFPSSHFPGGLSDTAVQHLITETCTCIGSLGRHSTPLDGEDFDKYTAQIIEKITEKLVYIYPELSVYRKTESSCDFL